MTYNFHTTMKILCWTSIITTIYTTTCTSTLLLGIITSNTPATSVVVAAAAAWTIPPHCPPSWRGRNCSKTELKMGMEIKIRIVGRKNGAEQWLEDAYVQYEKRLRSSNLDVSTVWHKHDEDITKNVEKDSEKGHSVVLLDPNGGLKTSEELSTCIYTWLDKGGSRLTFVIGGAEGLPSELKYATRPFPKLSLSPLTFTHQMTRTILMEQIYRASEIQKGTGYHK